MARCRVVEELHESKASPALRQAVCASRNVMIHQRIHRVLNAWKKSGRFRDRTSRKGHRLHPFELEPALRLSANGRLQIDNSQVENAIRPTVLGKKNWLFIGEAEAGDRSASLYTIIECCRWRGIDPLTYLRDVLTSLHRSIHKLAPENTLKVRYLALQAAA